MMYLKAHPGSFSWPGWKFAPHAIGGRAGRRTPGISLPRLVIFLIVTLVPMISHGAQSSYFQSSDYWAHTGMQVRQGQRYVLEVEWRGVADGQGWYAVPVQSLDGWPRGWQRWTAWPLALFRRRPFDPWFALIATVDGCAPTRLRANQTYRAPQSGELVCYFNDLPWMYRNNQGGVLLRLTPAP